MNIGWIFVKGGKFKIGKKKNPFKGKIKINLNGNYNLIVDDFFKCGKNVIVNVGTLAFYGKTPKIV